MPAVGNHRVDDMPTPTKRGSQVKTLRRRHGRVITPVHKQHGNPTAPNMTGNSAVMGSGIPQRGHMPQQPMPRIPISTSPLPVPGQGINRRLKSHNRVNVPRPIDPA